MELIRNGLETDSSDQIVINTYRKPSAENLKALILYLNSIASGKLSRSCIRQNIFKTRWSESEKSLRTRCHILAAALYLETLPATPSDQREASAKTVIADALPYVKKLSPNTDTSFVLGSTNTLPSTIHYKHAEWLFNHNDLPTEEKNRYGLDILVLYALRLSLEKRILGFLGIDFIEVNGKPCSFSKLIKVAKNLNNVQYDRSIKWDEIAWVNAWLNHHMHRHLRPYPWVIYQAFEILNPLLLPSSLVDGNTTHHSFYASTFVTDEDSFHNEVEHGILKTIQNAQIIWKPRTEILKRKVPGA